MKWQPYPKYKPSGACLPRCETSRRRQVEWLGEVPKHWEVKRLKGLAAYCVV